MKTATTDYTRDLLGDIVATTATISLVEADLDVDYFREELNSWRRTITSARRRPKWAHYTAAEAEAAAREARRVLYAAERRRDAALARERAGGAQ